MNNSALKQMIELHKNKHFDELYQIVNNASSITNWRFMISMSIASISWIIVNIVAVKYWQLSLYLIVILNMLLYWTAACFASPIAYSETKSAQKKRESNNMKKRIINHTEKIQEKNLSDYPLYPASEDIYEKFTEEEDLDPEDPSQKKVINADSSIDEWNEKSFDDDVSGDDLDVPGAELDDEQEAIGSEDEENNYYSLGGDNHDDLEEDRGE